MQDDAAAKRSFISVILQDFFRRNSKGITKKVHEMLCLCLMEEIIDDEEFVLLYEA